LVFLGVSKAIINKYEWVSQLVQNHASQGCTGGPAISDIEGHVISTKILDDSLVEVLKEIYNANN
jgi:hypothetical protein